MHRNLYIKLGIIAAVIILCVYGIYPPEKKIRRGLDLQGGVHVVLEVEQPANTDKTLSDLTDRALEVIRNRIDALGVSEPIIQKEGSSRILVDLPGVARPEKALEIIGRTALLEFRLVREDSDATRSESDLAAEYDLLYMKERDERGIMRDSNPIYVRKTAEITGAFLKDAYVGYDPSGFPDVNLEFNPDGAKRFEEITRQNVNRRLAIVLDGVVKSAPVIRERIPNGRANITGGFGMDEAKELALILRAGALPAKVNVIYRELVGPTLGRSYIVKGFRASLYGAIFVVAFMLVYYGAFGILANFAMAMNILILLAILAYVKGVLTLPGIAGIALTAGMAVDANILIFERMREEMRAGKSPRAIVDAGYHRAWSAILDSNITTLITGAVLFFLGEGPIKGFGLTLSVGIIANLFTAVFVTKVVTDWILTARNVQTLRV